MARSISPRSAMCLGSQRAAALALFKFPAQSFLSPHFPGFPTFSHYEIQRRARSANGGCNEPVRQYGWLYLFVNSLVLCYTHRR